MANVGSKGIDITSFDNWGLTKDVVVAAALKGQRKLAANILGESQKIVPVDTGTLRRSGTIKTNANLLMTTISYNTPYALKQHEEHKSKAKYLERPFNEKAGELKDFVQAEIDKALYEKSAQKATSKILEKYPDLNYEDYKKLL